MPRYVNYQIISNEGLSGSIQNNEELIIEKDQKVDVALGAQDAKVESALGRGDNPAKVPKEIHGVYPLFHYKSDAELFYTGNARFESVDGKNFFRPHDTPEYMKGHHDSLKCPLELSFAPLTIESALNDNPSIYPQVAFDNMFVAVPDTITSENPDGNFAMTQKKVLKKIEVFPSQMYDIYDGAMDQGEWVDPGVLGYRLHVTDTKAYIHKFSHPTERGIEYMVEKHEYIPFEGGCYTHGTQNNIIVLSETAETNFGAKSAIFNQTLGSLSNADGEAYIKDKLVASGKSLTEAQTCYNAFKSKLDHVTGELTVGPESKYYRDKPTEGLGRGMLMSDQTIRVLVFDFENNEVQLLEQSNCLDDTVYDSNIEAVIDVLLEDSPIRVGFEGSKGKYENRIRSKRMPRKSKMTLKKIPRTTISSDVITEEADRVALSNSYDNEHHIVCKWKQTISSIVKFTAIRDAAPNGLFKTYMGHKVNDLIALEASLVSLYEGTMPPVPTPVSYLVGNSTDLLGVAEENGKIISGYSIHSSRVVPVPDYKSSGSSYVPVFTFATTSFVDSSIADVIKTDKKFDTTVTRLALRDYNTTPGFHSFPISEFFNKGQISRCTVVFDDSVFPKTMTNYPYVDKSFTEQWFAPMTVSLESSTGNIDTYTKGPGHFFNLDERWRDPLDSDMSTVSLSQDLLLPQPMIDLFISLDLADATGICKMQGLSYTSVTKIVTWNAERTKWQWNAEYHGMDPVKGQTFANGIGRTFLTSTNTLVMPWNGVDVNGNASYGKAGISLDESFYVDDSVSTAAYATDSKLSHAEKQIGIHANALLESTLNDASKPYSLIRQSLPPASVLIDSGLELELYKPHQPGSFYGVVYAWSDTLLKGKMISKSATNCGGGLLLSALEMSLIALPEMPLPVSISQNLHYLKAKQIISVLYQKERELGWNTQTELVDNVDLANYLPKSAKITELQASHDPSSLWTAEYVQSLWDDFKAILSSVPASSWTLSSGYQISDYLTLLFMIHTHVVSVLSGVAFPLSDLGKTPTQWYMDPALGKDIENGTFIVLVSIANTWGYEPLQSGGENSNWYLTQSGTMFEKAFKGSLVPRDIGNCPGTLWILTLVYGLASTSKAPVPLSLNSNPHWQEMLRILSEFFVAETALGAGKLTANSGPDWPTILSNAVAAAPNLPNFNEDKFTSQNIIDLWTKYSVALSNLPPHSAWDLVSGDDSKDLKWWMSHLLLGHVDAVAKLSQLDTAQIPLTGYNGSNITVAVAMSSTDYLQSWYGTMPVLGSSISSQIPQEHTVATLQAQLDSLDEHTGHKYPFVPVDWDPTDPVCNTTIIGGMTVQEAKNLALAWQADSVYPDGFSYVKSTYPSILCNCSEPGWRMSSDGTWEMFIYECYASKADMDTYNNDTMVEYAHILDGRFGTWRTAQTTSLSDAEAAAGYVASIPAENLRTGVLYGWIAFDPFYTNNQKVSFLQHYLSGTSVTDGACSGGRSQFSFKVSPFSKSVIHDAKSVIKATGETDSVGAGLLPIPVQPATFGQLFTYTHVAWKSNTTESIATPPPPDFFTANYYCTSGSAVTTAIDDGDVTLFEDSQVGIQSTFNTLETSTNADMFNQLATLSRYNVI